MSDKELNVLNGEKIEIKVGGKAVEVSRLTIDEQFLFIDEFPKYPEDMVLRMVSVINFCSKNKFIKEDFISAAEVVNAFGDIWKQNEFDFLFKGVQKLNSVFRN